MLCFQEFSVYRQCLQHRNNSLNGIAMVNPVILFGYVGDLNKLTDHEDHVGQMHSQRIL